jgi:CRP-like cAMP-binding protein
MIESKLHQQDNESLAAVKSFRDASYESQEMKKLLSLHAPDEKVPMGLSDISYNPSNVFPEWILGNAAWRNAPKQIDNANEISDILNTPLSKRTSDQTSTIIHWLMSVWGIANSMGFKRCAAMFREFNFSAYEPGESIIKEGERGLTFYIIVSGTASVHKEGIGVVGQLSKGKGFGEIALTQGKDLRTATVTSMTRVEVLSLRKLEYDYFVRDLQEMEKRENFMILSQCKLFRSWPKGKIEKACNACLRKTFEAGSYIFRQGDPPDDLFVVIEGSVNIFKELVIVCKNRWPVAMDEWKERVRRVTKPIMLTTLQRGDFFGEMAILKNQARSTSAIAGTRCILITLDKNEFLHLVNNGSAPGHTLRDDDEELQQALQKYVDDDDVIEIVSEIKGGPNSAAFVGNKKVQKTELENRVHAHLSYLPDTVSSGGYSSNAKQTKKANPLARSHPLGRIPSHTASSYKNHSTFAASPKPNEKEMMEITRQADVTEKIRKAVMETYELKEDKLEPKAGYKIIEAFSHPHRKDQVRSAPSGEFRSKQRFLSDKKPTALVVQVPPLAGSNPLPPHRSSIAFLPQKRLSLPGLDNDVDSTFDPNRIILRRNSAINFGRLYEHLYHQLRQDGLNSPSHRKSPVRRSVFFEPNSSKPLNADVPVNITDHVPFSEKESVRIVSGTVDQCTPDSPNKFIQPLLAKLSRRDTQRSRLMTRSSSFIVARQPGSSSNFEDSDGLKAENIIKNLNSAIDLAAEVGTRKSIIAANLKLLNKSKVSYRDVMEG